MEDDFYSLDSLTSLEARILEMFGADTLSGSLSVSYNSGGRELTFPLGNEVSVVVFTNSRMELLELSLNVEERGYISWDRDGNLWHLDFTSNSHGARILCAVLQSLGEKVSSFPFELSAHEVAALISSHD